MSTITAVQHKGSANVPVRNLNWLPDNQHSLSTKHLSIVYLNTTNPGVYLNLPTPFAHHVHKKGPSGLISLAILSTSGFSHHHSHVLHAAECQKKLIPTHTQATGFVCLFKVTAIFPPFIWSSNESAKSGWIRLSFFHKTVCDVVVQCTLCRASLRDAN